MKYNWDVISVASKKNIIELASKLKISSVLANLLIDRGIDTVEDAIKFFNPNVKNEYSSDLLKDIDKAKNRVLQAYYNYEKVMIWGDYDVDGTTGTALLYRILKPYFPNISYYIPDRYSEGYGISMQGIDFAISTGINLIISVDTGIKNIQEIVYAKDRGIDFIVLDHHTPSEELPPAVAVIDPKREDDLYPFKELTGCGVAFKFLQSLSESLGIEQKFLYKHLDLLALSIAADIVPIVDENRIYAYLGLKLLNTSPLVGISALKEVIGLKNKELSISNLVFTLIPRLNAAGRIGHGSQAVELLISENFNKALEIAKEINYLNQQRQHIQQKIVNEIIQEFKEHPELKEKNSTVLFNSHWHKGVIGIVASKVIDYFYKPTVILTDSENDIAGSARSIADFDLYEAIEDCSHLLTKFGGHKYAAGLSLKPENLNKFIDCFENVVSARITDDMKKPKLKISGVLTINDINENLIKFFRKLEPYGPGNPKPIFVSTDVKEVYIKKIGKDKNHLVLRYLDEQTGKIISAISFYNADLYDKIFASRKYDIAYKIGENEYNNVKYIQLEIIDFRFK